MRQVILFDVDGTLVDTRGAGRRALSRAFGDLFELNGAFDGIVMAGRTDRSILEEAVGRAGLELDAPRLEAFRNRYLQRLQEALAEPGYGQFVMPGVRTLLLALASRRDVFVALLTGNYERGAQLKLEHFDLWRFFPCGGFGDAARDRHELFPLAMARVRACGVPDVAPHEVIVVGDTVLDVQCAAGAGARAVAVATGPTDIETLRQSGADLVLENLEDTRAFLRWL